LRCLRCWLFVVDRTGALPTLAATGGGELVLEAEMEADTTLAVSLTSSLAGVSGRREAATEAEGTVGGASVFGVATTRSVLGAARAAGVVAEAGVAAVGVGSGGKDDVDFAMALVFSGSFSGGLTAAPMSSTAGAARFSAALGNVGTLGVGNAGTLGAVAAISFPLAGPSAGKSSSWRTGPFALPCLCEDMSVDRPLSAARALMALLASAPFFFGVVSGLSPGA